MPAHENVTFRWQIIRANDIGYEVRVRKLEYHIFEGSQRSHLRFDRTNYIQFSIPIGEIWKIGDLQVGQNNLHISIVNKNIYQK